MGKNIIFCSASQHAMYLTSSTGVLISL